MLIRRAALSTLGVWLLLVSQAAAFHDEAPVRAGMLRASNQILNLDLDSAEATCRDLLTLPRGKAAGHFCLGLVALAKAEDRDDPAPELDRFMEHATAALAAGESLERTAPSDAEVKLLLGLIQGSRALVEGERRNYLSALQDVREAHRRFQEALQLDADLVDASYGLGVYNLAMGQLPGILRSLATIVLPHGDAEQGLKLLEQVAERGAFLKMTARVVLLQFYAGQDRKYAEAFRLGKDLLRRYPGNPDLYFATAHAASELGRFDDALEIGRRVEQQIAEGRPRFAQLGARYEQLMGKVYMDHGDYDTALTFFQRAVQEPTPARYRWITAWAWTRSGMIYDLQGDRQEAVRRYRSALEVETDGPAKDLARQYLEVPYRGRQGVRS